MTFIAVLSAAYVFVLVNAPLSLLATATHDDGLFMTLGWHLSNGRWLGPYSQFTLMKGPGYPAFLALSSFLGVSSSFARALFHCVAISGFVMICHRFHRSAFASALLFALLLWDPSSFQGKQLRILRDTIYYGETLLSLAVLTFALFRQDWKAGVCGGMLFAWLWLTREEGIWLVPGVALLVVTALYAAFRERSVRRFALTVCAIAVAFGFVNASFRAINWWTYGAPVGVDAKERNFVNALGAIHSVRSGGIARFVSVTRATRDAIYPVSPAFASLAPYLDGEMGRSWGSITCAIQAFTCGEIGSGVFPWALRDAVAAAGHYASPAKASHFYEVVAREITAACERKQLECDRQLIAEMPPATREQLAVLPLRVFDGLKMVLSSSWQPVDGGPSFATTDQLVTALRFLNYPFIQAPNEQTNTSYMFEGWYYRPGGGWISVSVSEDSEFTPVLLKRAASPDVATFFKDTSASQQRFSLQTTCSGNCILRVVATDGSTAEMRLQDIRTGTVAVGQGTLHLTPTGGGLHRLYEPNSRNRLSFRVRAAIMRSFELARVPVLILGFIAAFGCFFYWREAALNPVFALALVSWGLAASRITVVTLMDLTFVPAIDPVYLAPASFLLTAAAILSIVAWMQLRNSAAALPPNPLAAA
jgi:hypothetical protein